MSTNQHTLKEAVERLRRIETRLTSFLVDNGLRVYGQTPVWDGQLGVVYLDKTDCPLSTILNAIPKDCAFREVNVIVDGEIKAVVFPD